MRTLYLLRGIPGSGKSFWVEKNGLKPYTLSADGIRLTYQAPAYTIDGKLTISQKNDADVWELLFNLLKKRMSRGEFCIVDATHYKKDLMSRYKKLAEKYRYRVFVVDFTAIPLETCLQRNLKRDKYKFVPEDAIAKMYEVIKGESENNKQVVGGFKVISPEAAEEKLSENLIYDFNKYRNIYIIGDIHGCHNPLKKFFDAHPYNEDDFYLFTGDYLDRGLQNREVLTFLIELTNLSNVLFLEGNHEHWLKMYCSKTDEEFLPTVGEFDILKKFCPKSLIRDLRDRSYSAEFKKTMEQIQDIDKSQIREFCRKLAQMALFSYKGKVYCVTHGGIPVPPSIFMATSEMIKGVGKYEEIEQVYESWQKNTPENYVLIHGHRNIKLLPTKINDRIYNLCDDVEYGGNLRVMTINGDSTICEEYKNDIPAQREEKQMSYRKIEFKTDDDLLESLNKNKNIIKKELDDDVISYNFSRNVFERGIWNDMTVKARGLFIDRETSAIVARSYDKFFGWGERNLNSTNYLKQVLKFPVSAYRKYNGFLGLISYNKKKDKLFISSKSTNKGTFAEMVAEAFSNLPTSCLIEAFLKENDVTMIFEVIDKRDPHIIKYNENHLVLLDIVTNSFMPEFLAYDALKAVGDIYGLEVKEKDYTFNNWEELVSFKMQMDNDSSQEVEGWVFSDMNNYMIKYKTPFYNWWKRMRGVKDRIAKGSPTRQVFASKKEVELVNLMKEMPAEELAKMSIIDVREKYNEVYHNEEK